MTTRKLALVVLALVLGVALSLSWYLHGEQVAAKERAATRSNPAPTSWTGPAARTWIAARVALDAGAHGDRPSGS